MLHSKFYQLQILHHLDNDLFGNYFVILNHLYNGLFGNCFVIFTPQEGMSSRFQIIPFVVKDHFLRIRDQYWIQEGFQIHLLSFTNEENHFIVR